MALDLAASCRYVVIDNYVSREVAGRSRSEVLNVFRQGEVPPSQSWSGHIIIDVPMHAGHCAHCQLRTSHFQSVCAHVCAGPDVTCCLQASSKKLRTLLLPRRESLQVHLQL